MDTNIHSLVLSLSLSSFLWLLHHLGTFPLSWWQTTRTIEIWPPSSWPVRLINSPLCCHPVPTPVFPSRNGEFVLWVVKSGTISFRHHIYRKRRKIPPACAVALSLSFDHDRDGVCMRPTRWRRAKQKMTTRPDTQTEQNIIEELSKQND